MDGYEDYVETFERCQHTGEQFENARGDLKCMECGAVIEWAADREDAYQEFKATAHETGGPEAVYRALRTTDRGTVSEWIARYEREEDYLPHVPSYDPEYTPKYRTYMDLRRK